MANKYCTLQLKNNFVFLCIACVPHSYRLFFFLKTSYMKLKVAKLKPKNHILVQRQFSKC